MKEKRLTQKTSIRINIMILATLLLFIIGTTFGGAEWKNDLEHQVESNTEDIIELNGTIKDVLIQLREQEISFIEVITDLKWIRAKMEEE